MPVARMEPVRADNCNTTSLVESAGKNVLSDATRDATVFSEGIYPGYNDCLFFITTQSGASLSEGNTVKKCSLFNHIYISDVDEVSADDIEQ